jgi:hypothetical protein
LGACDATAPQPLPEIWRFHFPTGMAIDTPYALGQAQGTRAQFLYLAGNSNFDQAASRGVVMAVNLDGYGPPSTGLMPPGLLPDGGGSWDGTPLQFPDVGDAGTVDPDGGYVYTDSLGGELRLSPTSAGGQRVVLAARGQNTLGFIDVNPGGATLSCVDGDAGQDCLNANSSPTLDVPGANGGNEILDVFALSYPVQATLPGGGKGPPELFVGHLRDVTTAVSSVAGAPNPYTNTSTTTVTTQAFVIRQSVDEPSCSLAEYIGTVPAAGVMGLPGPDGVYAITTGRFSGLSDANVEVLTLPPSSCPAPAPPAPGQLPVNMTPRTETIDLSQILKETDGRGLALSSSGDRVFALSIGPDSLAVLRIDGEAPTSLLIHPSAVVPLPNGPSEMAVIPRTAPDGSPVGDLVAVSCPGSDVLAFYDDEIGTVTAALPGVGDEPFAISTAPRTFGNGPSAQLIPGVRLFVTAFGSGQVAVVDLPDPLDATSARVIAMLGSYEDTTASPVNPLTSQILTLPYGYSGGSGGI